LTILVTHAQRSQPAPLRRIDASPLVFYLRAVLASHIAAGAVAFICPPVALLTAEGGRTHQRWSKIYFRAMVVAATALFLSIVLPIVFFALVAAFSFCAAFCGFRILSLKRLGNGDKPHFLDWCAALLNLGSSAALVFLGAIHPRIVGGMGLVAVVFGVIGVLLAAASVRTLLRPPPDKQFRWCFPLRGMIARYIAAFTAFAVVNLAPHFGNGGWIWPGPAIVGVPGGILWKRHYRQKLSSSRRRRSSPARRGR
jgi:hypothetical protein